MKINKNKSYKKLKNFHSKVYQLDWEFDDLLDKVVFLDLSI